MADGNEPTRNVVLATALDGDQLLFRSMRASDQLGRPFQFDIVAVRSDAEIEAGALLGKNATVSFEICAGASRYFNGFVTSFAHAEGTLRLSTEFTLRPWLWFLTRRANCRIFQNKQVPDIVKERADEYLAVLESKLGG